MREQRLEIASGSHLLEAAYQPGDGMDGVVICHPHPLYGGNMDNNVVIAVKESLAARGWATLRFNFRGVGSSGGQYGNGEGEVEDLLAVFDHLQERGIHRAHVAGYSYGAWIALRAAAQTVQPASLCLISPPIDLLDFSRLTLPWTPTLITLGNSDSFCTLSALKNWLAQQGANPNKVCLEIIEGCDHFYGGHEATLDSRITAFVSLLSAGYAAGKTDPPGN